MPAGDPAYKRATIEDFLAAEAEGRRVELIDGMLVERELAGKAHAVAHGGVFGTLRPPFRGRGDGERPGGWTFLIEPSLLVPNGDVLQPDIAGWHFERPPANETVITSAPDWVCEVAASSHSRDVRQKPKAWHAMNIGHYWVVDLKWMTLTVYRWSPPGYILVDAVGPEGKVRLEPFDAVEFDAWEFFGFDEAPPSPAVTRA